MSSLENLASTLNKKQFEAMQALEGPLLILAGAGSGKTRVLTYRTANLVAQGLATPQEILAVTFTNKAAREMEARILALLAELEIPVYDRMWISTFHSICARILRSHIELLGYQSTFTIYDQTDQLSMVKQVCTRLQLDEKVFPAKNFQARINHAKTLAVTPDELQYSQKKNSLSFDEQSTEVYTEYEKQMKQANAVDFQDLLLKVYQLFQTHPGVLEAYQERFRFLMVDEYQDTNHIQYLLVKALANKTRNLCVVGDEDQSIYSWRGADIQNILDFEKDFPEAVVIKLEQNYRSTKTIVGAATKVVAYNSERKEKELFTENADGDLITVREEQDEYEEARYVVRQIQKILSESEMSRSDIAIFYRTNAQSRVLEEQLRSNSLAYKIVGGMKFYDRLEIKDVLGYMKLVLNPTDDIAFKRVINVPARGIGKTTIEKLEDLGQKHGVSLIQAASYAVDQREFNAGTTSKIRRFLELMQILREKAQALSLDDFYSELLTQTEYTVKLKLEDSPEADSRLENLEELANAISKFVEERRDEANLQSFLEEMALISDVDSMNDNENTITMMTLHISKGLEYPVVFIVGLEEGLFPSGQSINDESESRLEEERRLMYVGMTRAEKKLTLSYARARKVWGSEQNNPPSRFLKEIPPEFVETQTSQQSSRFMQKYAEHSRGGSGEFRSSNSAPRNSRKTETSHPSYEDFSDESFDDSGDDLYKKGMRIRHPTFGVGTIFKTDGSGESMDVSVVFADNSVKKFRAKYARLERV